MIRKIFPSAGHNDKDPGAVSGKLVEAELTKEARNLIVKNFSTKDFISDKDSEDNHEYQYRIKPMKGSVVFDIHFNLGIPSASGTECFVSKEDFANKNSMSYKMAKEVCDTTSKILNIPNRGVKPDNESQHTQLGILHLGAGCSVLWEICFISSKDDMSKYNVSKIKLHNEIAKILKKYDDMVL